MENPVFTRLARPSGIFILMGIFPRLAKYDPKMLKPGLVQSPFLLAGSFVHEGGTGSRVCSRDRGSGENRPQQCRCRWLLTLRRGHGSGVRLTSSDSKKSTKV